MTVLNLQVGDNANDGGGLAGLSFGTTQATRWLGLFSGYDGYLWDRFTGAAGIAGVTVSSATVSYLAAISGTITVKAAAEDADNPTMPSSDADCSGRTLTAAVSSGSVSPTADNWFSLDVTAPIQTVVNRPGFAEDAINIRSGNDSGASYVTVYRRESDPAKAAKLDITYTAGAAAPTVSSVSANSGPAAGGTNVTITGTGFVATPTVTFGGTSATNVAFVNSTTITCTTPAHAAGAVDVVVTNPDTQTGTGTNAFTYVAAPTVSSVSANSGTTSGGTNVTITGTGFVATPTVTFGGTSATNVAFVNSTTITCTTPAHAAGAVDVVVTNPDTQTGTGTNAFTYQTPVTADAVGINLGIGFCLGL